MSKLFRARSNKIQDQYAFIDQSEPIHVVEYQKRYLKMVLTICAKLVEKDEAYLETEEFFNDLFNSFPNPDTNLPIYFDLQNNAYEVPVFGGYTSSHWFMETKELTTVKEAFNLLDNPNPIAPILITSYAAPDLRKIETTPLDTRATSNKILQYPKTEGLMGMMLTTGIAAQCQAAIQLAEQYKRREMNQPIAVVFIMPGCGAFKNPEKQTALQFISAIKYYYPELSKLGISCHIAEYSPEIYKLLEEVNNSFGPELGQLNEAIMRVTDPEIRMKTIKVKERILDLYANGSQPQSLIQHINLTLRLLTTPPGNERKQLIDKYQQNAYVLIQNENSLMEDLGLAMTILGAALMISGIVLVITGVGLIVGAGTFFGGAGLLSVSSALSARQSKDIVNLSEDFILSSTPNL